MNWLETLQKLPAFTDPELQTDPELLYDPVRIRIELTLKDARAEGLSVMLFETFRADARQLNLWKQKRTKIKKRGMHGCGMAGDIVFVDAHGQPSWKEPTPGAWKRLGVIGKKHGLYWGGDFKSFTDSPHFQGVPATPEAQGKILKGEYP